ncbi:restriction endonuclease subunit S [Enterocloster bolteae]|uniref:restriction endonuclease subunit S n=1 Tax=Enterocloster bolteae TaxID=208479 RepID=UPI001A9A3C48|nr:restriction endonuclease subunit S [Enterocloster bolteae]
MTDFTPSTEQVADKSFLNSFGSSGRLDAVYYQTKYDALFAKLSAVKTYLLGDLVWIKKSVEPGSNEYLSEGIPFVRVSDLSKYGLSNPEIHLRRIPFAHMNLQPKKETILLSKDGSVGIAYKVEKDLDIVTSGAILHLEFKTDQFLPDYLTLVLNSLIVKMQAERDAGGSIIQHWKPSEIKKVVIPWLPIDKQEQISYKIQGSFSLRRESKELLERAKQAVEMAIEKDEQTALNWLVSKE